MYVLKLLVKKHYINTQYYIHIILIYTVKLHCSQGLGGPCRVRSKLNRFSHVLGSLYGEVQCVVGNSHVGPPR